MKLNSIAAALMLALVMFPQHSYAQTDDGTPITGILSLPEKTPEWFVGGKLDLSDAKIEVYLQQGDDYESVAELNAGKDGSFSTTLEKPGKYYIFAYIQHKKADESSYYELSWALSDKEFRLKKDAKRIDLGTIVFELQNALVVGEQAPEWKGKAYDGSTIKLSDFRGKYLLIDFWATWCGPCIAEMPNIKKTYEAFKGDRFAVIGLNVDDTIEEAIAFEKKKPAPYRNAFLGKPEDNETMLAYGVDGIPSIWLIGPDGKIIARDLRGQEIYKAVEKVLSAAQEN